MDSMYSSLRFPSEMLEKAALLFLAVVYTIRLIWIHKQFRKSTDRQPKTGSLETSRTKGALYSLCIIALPWEMESFRKHKIQYIFFVLFHLGIAAAISLAFVITYGSFLLDRPIVLFLFRMFLLLGTIVGILKTVRRFRDPVLKTVSTPDDYFSVISCTVWPASGLLMLSFSVGAGDVFLQIYFYLLVFLSLYAPFSKISHYLYYPFTRAWFGASMGHRGVYPLARSRDKAVS